MDSKTIQKESYSAYQRRIQELLDCRACFPPENEPLATARGLEQKLYADGSFRPFYGDTVVFQLPEDAKRVLGDIQSSLYGAAGGMLAEPLPADTFHITLHDLCAASLQRDVQAAAEAHRTQLRERLPYITGRGSVRLFAKGMVSMVSSSIVMLFVPVCETDHRAIQDMYGCLEEIRPLPYPLTLHCTLAYYKPGIYSPAEWNSLYRFIHQWNAQHPDAFSVSLDGDAIAYQSFCSMCHYTNVLDCAGPF